MKVKTKQNEEKKRKLSSNKSKSSDFRFVVILIMLCLLKHLFTIKLDKTMVMHNELELMGSESISTYVKVLF
jgi:hypothetical protein